MTKLIEKIRNRSLLAAQIAILLAQIVGLAIAASTTGLAQEPSALTANNFDPITDCAHDYRDEMRTRAGIAVSKARHDVLTDLRNKNSSDVRLEMDTTGERG